MRCEKKSTDKSRLPCVTGVLASVALLLLGGAEVYGRGAHPVAVHHMHAGGFGHHGHGTIRHAARVHYRAQQAQQLQRNRIDAAEDLQDQRWDNTNNTVDHANDAYWDRYGDYWDGYYNDLARSGSTVTGPLRAQGHPAPRPWGAGVGAANWMMGLSP